MNCSLCEPEAQESLFLPPTFKSDVFSPHGQQLPLLTRDLSCSLGFLLHPCFWVRSSASAPKRALGTEKRGFLNKPEMLSLKIRDSQLRCHRIAHIATAALGIFISFALLLLLLCFIQRHPLTPHALG